MLVIPVDTPANLPNPSKPNVGRHVVMEDYNFPDVTGKVVDEEPCADGGSWWYVSSGEGEKPRKMHSSKFLWVPDVIRA